MISFTLRIWRDAQVWRKTDHRSAAIEFPSLRPYFAHLQTICGRFAVVQRTDRLITNYGICRDCGEHFQNNLETFPLFSE